MGVTKNDLFCPKTSGQQVTGQQVTGQQVTGQQVTGQQVTGQQATGQQVTGQQVTTRAGQQVTGQQVTGQQVTRQQETGQQVTGQQATGQQVTGQQVTGQQVTTRAGQQMTWWRAEAQQGKQKTLADPIRLAMLWLSFFLCLWCSGVSGRVAAGSPSFFMMPLSAYPGCRYHSFILYGAPECLAVLRLSLLHTLWYSWVYSRVAAVVPLFLMVLLNA